jgi:hypothetical protein
VNRTNTDQVKVVDRTTGGNQADNTHGGGGGPGGSGTVRSFSAGDFVPLFLSIVDNPSTEPALSFAAIAKAAGLFYAGPVSGPDADADFRLINILDLPDLSSVYELANVTLAAIAALSDSVGYLYNNGSGVLTWADIQGNQNSPQSVVVYFQDTAFATGGLFTLQNFPGVGVEQLDAALVNNNAVLIEGYVANTVIGNSEIPAGEWIWDEWASVSNTGGNNFVVLAICKRMVGAGTLAVTGSGTSRTATITGGTPFVSGDANANPLLAGRVETPTASFQITAFTDDHTVTIATPTGYSNESTVAYAVHRWLFSMTTPDLSSTSISAYETIVVEPAFTGIAATDRLSIFVFASRTAVGNRTITHVHNGSTHYSHLHTPLSQLATSAGLTMNSARILARWSAGLGPLQEAQIGANLSLSAAGVLSAASAAATLDARDIWMFE